MGGGERRLWIAEDLVPAAAPSLPEGIRLEVLPLGREALAAALEGIAPGDLVLLSFSVGGVNPLLLGLHLKMRFMGSLRLGFRLPEGFGREARALARFCMADALVPAALLEAPDWAALVGRLEQRDRPRPRRSVDELLDELEAKIGGEARAIAERVVKGFTTPRRSSFLDKVLDAESGLFDGAYMAFKVEEEFKRSLRFHDPLSILLVDLPGSRALEGAARAAVLGKVAGVFLNECRDIDVVGRYDDTSFLLLLPETPEEGALVLARRVLQTLEAEVESPVPLEPAVAVVSVPRPGILHKDELLDLARLTLVQAWSAEGGDRIRTAP